MLRRSWSLNIDNYLICLRQFLRHNYFDQANKKFNEAFNESIKIASYALETNACHVRFELGFSAHHLNCNLDWTLKI